MKLSFLGPEFLTWLYFHLDKLDGRLSIGNRVSLRPMNNEEQKVSISSPNLEDSGEFLQAIRSGAYVESLALDLVIDERIHSFTLNALDGSLSGVKTQGLDKSTGDSEEAEIMIRMSNLDEIEDVLKKIFARFLELRLGVTFMSEEVKAMRESVAEGLSVSLLELVSCRGFGSRFWSSRNHFSSRSCFFRSHFYGCFFGVFAAFAASRNAEKS